MNFLQNLPYKECILVKDNLFIGHQNQRIFLTRHSCDSDNYDRYYLRIKNQKGENIGYLYFNLDCCNKECKFIGIAVSEEYRNCGMASLLISSWIQLCLDNGFENLATISKQRKPFILYLLKKYMFELKNMSTYETSDQIVYICQEDSSNYKCIMFKNYQQEQRFRNSKIMKTDNYKIISCTDSITILEQVALYSPYYLQDNEYAYQKSLGTFKKYS